MTTRSDGVKPPETPELDRRSEIINSERHPHLVLTEFYDWLKEQGLQLCKYETREVEEPCQGRKLFSECGGDDCAACGGTGWVKVPREDWWQDVRQPERLFLDFFGLDQDKIDAEQRALLDYLRKRS